VPEKYKNKEKEILNFFKKSRKSVIEAEQDVLRREVPNYIKNQQIEIIWLANDQKIFSFNLEVFKTENNMIIDPIIQVVTEGNSVAVDRDSILGGGSTDPLKIKLVNRDTALTYKTLEPELKRLKLDDNLKYLVTVDQLALQEIYDLQKQMKQLLLISLGLLLGFFFLVTQNLIVFFNKYQQKFVVHRLFGIDFFRTYKQYISLFAVTWIIQILICFFVNRAVDIKFLAVAAILICIESIASVIALMTIEQRNKIKVLKGGY
jgi:putative ABC transport system permease protein